MGVRIRYMGAKHSLAPIVAAVVESMPQGPFLDLFAGMCSVAGVLAPSGRAIWCNDVQQYAHVVASALLTSVEPRRSEQSLLSVLLPYFKLNLESLRSRFSEQLELERLALGSHDQGRVLDLHQSWKHAGNDPRIAGEVECLRNSPVPRPYLLATLLFSHGYFGLAQSMEIDSIRFAIDAAGQDALISKEERDYLLAALLQTASQVATTSGHFAQYLTPKNPGNFRRFCRLRLISPWSRLQTELGFVQPFGEAGWRASNRAMCGEALELLRLLDERGEAPAVVYADPPYSKAQYSRYYHVLETLVRYDYPRATGKGRYRDNRFQTPFSLSAHVVQSFEVLTRSVQSMGASIVVSYPAKGLLAQQGVDLREIVASQFSETYTICVDSQHSTLGGAPGRESTEIQELIVVGRGRDRLKWV